MGPMAPFVDADSVLLRYLGGRDFELESTVTWEDPADGSVVVVPPGTRTDLASVPPFLWGLVASYGRQTLPAILHDHLSDLATDFRDAREADARFQRALRERGVPDVRAAAMWAAVGIASWVRFRSLLGLLFVAVMVAGVAAVVAGIVLAVLLHPLWLLLVLAPAVPSLLWGREAGLQLTATYLFALYSPLIVSAAVLTALEYAISFVLWALRGFRGAPPTPGPTARVPRQPR